jgi:hypothetical protein
VTDIYWEDEFNGASVGLQVLKDFQVLVHAEGGYASILEVD